MPSCAVTEANRTKIGGIVSDFYQAYLNGFAPNVYYNTEAPATPEFVSVALPVAQAQVSPLHGFGLATLLFLIAILVAATLRLQTIPNPQSTVWDLYPATLLKHVSKSTLPLFQRLRNYAHSNDEDIIAELGGQHFAFANGLVIPCPAYDEEAPHAPGETPEQIALPLISNRTRTSQDDIELTN
jgi:hypothetical protein